MDRHAGRSMRLTIGLLVLAACGVMGEHGFGQASPQTGPVSTPTLAWNDVADFNTGRAEFGLVQGEIASQRYLYAIAGETSGGAVLPTTENTQLATPFTAWVTGGADLPEPLAYQGALALNGWVYVIGGWNGSANVKTVRSAQIGQSGLLGAWTLRDPLPDPARGRSALAVVSYTKNDTSFVYALGGWDGRGPTDTIYRAIVGQDGALTWVLLPTRLPEPLFQFAALAYQDGLYVIGGRTNSGRSKHIYRYPIQPDGSLGVVSQLADLPEERDNHAAVIYSGALVVLGGRDANGQSTKTIYVAGLAADGSLVLPWDSQSLPKALEAHGAVVANVAYCGEVIYVAGGRSGASYESSVYRTDCPQPEAWSDWKAERTHGEQPLLLVCRVASVSILYWNQTVGAKLEATLNDGGPVVFDNDTYKREYTLETTHGVYDLKLKSAPASAPGEAFSLNATIDSVQVGSGPLPGVTAPCTFLPLVLKNKAP
jgi:hypothetical protein